MKKLLLLTLLCLTLLQTTSAYQAIKNRLPQPGKYTVVRVYDGDTFTILLPGTYYTVHVRINGIDAPERRQDFGMYAKLYLEALIDNQPVHIVPLELDMYGRAVCTVYNANNQDIAFEMLTAGMAWHHTGYDKTESYIKAAEEAQLTKQGLWCRPNPMNPYDYRKAPRHIKLRN